MAAIFQDGRHLKDAYPPMEGLDRCLEGLAICHYNPKVFSTTPQKENQIWALGSPQGANQ